MCDCENCDCEKKDEYIGWICPRCGVSLSPQIDFCACSYQYIEIAHITPFKVWSFKKMMDCLREG